MNKDWVQYWIKLFDRKGEELIALYAPEFYFIDINMQIEIENDLEALKEFHGIFDNSNPEEKYDYFDVFDYAGDERRGCFQWTWKAKHVGDFLGLPAAGKETETRGMTLMEWDENGKITREESICDLLRIFRQLGIVNQ